MNSDLDKLAAVCGFAIEDGMTHLRITSLGTNDKKYLKRVAKKFPKRLRGAPFTVNYKIKAPIFSDLIIDGGQGDLNISAVEGTMRISFVQSNAKLNLIGGTVQATIGSGNVDVTVATRSWARSLRGNKGASRKSKRLAAAKPKRKFNRISVAHRKNRQFLQTLKTHEKNQIHG